MNPRQLQLRDEILQVLFWVRGEKLDEEAGLADLTVWLGVDGDELEPVIAEMLGDGFLVAGSRPDTWTLSEVGLGEGGRRFTEEFADAGLGAQGHGECGPECDCSKHGPDGCSHHSHQHDDHTHDVHLDGGHT